MVALSPPLPRQLHSRCCCEGRCSVFALVLAHLDSDQYLSGALESTARRVHCAFAAFQAQSNRGRFGDGTDIAALFSYMRTIGLRLRLDAPE